VSRTVSGEVAIVGAYESPRRKAKGVHPFEIHAECVRGALDDAGLTLADVDGFCTAAGDAGEGGGYSDLFDVADYLGVHARWFDSTETGGASAIHQAGHAVSAIATGRANVVAISYAACPKSWPIEPLFWDGLTYPAAAGQFEIPYGLTLIGSYAMVAQRHMHEYGTTSEQLAHVSVTCRANAAQNPHARFRDPLTITDVLESPMIASPLRKFDCCPLTEGGGAVVLAGRERVADTPKPPVWILGSGDELSGLSLTRIPELMTTPTGAAAERAYAMAGVRPSDIDCAQVYDGYTIMVVMSLEDLGFCDKGDGGHYVASGAIAPDGALPINTDGGGLSSNQPGKRGMFNLIEGVRQIRGEGPGAQVPECRTALVHGLGGFFSASAVMILGAD
jgi:acetyl-CoA acetyltransferase